MMHQVVDGGTGGARGWPGREAAGKTGTTQAARDAWFLGFTADYVAGVWMGYDDNTPLTGVTGGGLPAEIWRETMAGSTRGCPRPLADAQAARNPPKSPIPSRSEPDTRERATRMASASCATCWGGTEALTAGLSRPVQILDQAVDVAEVGVEHRADLGALAQAQADALDHHVEEQVRPDRSETRKRTSNGASPRR